MSPGDRPTAPRSEANNAYALGEISGKIDSLSSIIRAHIEASMETWKENREQWAQMALWQRGTESKIADVMAHGIATSRRVDDLEKSKLTMEEVRSVIREEVAPILKDIENLRFTKPMAVTDKAQETREIDSEARSVKWIVEKLLMPLINPIITAIIIYILLQVIPNMNK